MGTTLSGLTPATTFDALIKVGDNSALSASLKTISDGEGNDSPLKLSTSAVGIGSITNVETEINGKQATLVSGTNIKSINSTSLLGSGDLSVQETLVSGTNIKTINSTSLLGSGDISISASPAGSNTQIQFNDSGAFGADSLFNWDNTNKRLGVGETTPTAKVHIKGEGATSATTSLLVQNSSGSDVLKVTDDKKIIFGGDTEIDSSGLNALIVKRNGSELLKTDGSSLNGAVIFKGNLSNQFSLGVRGNDFNIWDGSYLGGGDLRFSILPDGKTAIGAQTPTAKLHIKGIGATSSTTAMLVENSAGTDSLSIKDDGQVLVNVQSAEASAKLQIDSTTQGFLPPRMTTTQVNAIEATAGLIVYDTTTNKLKCYDGSSWNNLF